MSVIVEMPTPLRRFTDESEEVAVEATTVEEALRRLVDRHPALGRHLFTGDGALRSFVNVFLNDEDVRFLEQGKTRVAPGDRISIIPSIAGGRR